MTPPPALPSPASDVDAALDASIGRLPSEGPLVVLFSGGVDSGLLAWELRRRKEVRLSTFGVADSPDLIAARSAAGITGLPWAPVEVVREGVFAMRDRVVGWVGPLPPTEEAIETAFALAVQSAPPGALVCGQGADELFYGYAHYQRLDRRAAEVRSELDLSQLQASAWPRARTIAGRMGRSVHAPYLDSEFVDAVRRVPVGERFQPGHPKAWFRTWAIGRGLPEEIAGRPKKALQYGSGVDRLLKKRFRRP